MTTLLKMALTVKCFDQEKVHVYARRKQKDPTYDISPITADLCWLSRYVMFTEVKYNPYNNRDSSLEECMAVGVTSAIEVISTYPLENPWGWFMKCIKNGMITWFRNNQKLDKLPKLDAMKDGGRELPCEALVPSAIDHLLEIEALIGKRWSGNGSVNRKVNNMLRETIETKSLQTTYQDHAESLYRAILVGRLKPERIPQEEVLTARFQLYSLLVGEGTARKLQWLDRYSKSKGAGRIHRKNYENFTS